MVWMRTGRRVIKGLEFWEWIDEVVVKDSRLLRG